MKAARGTSTSSRTSRRSTARSSSATCFGANIGSSYCTYGGEKSTSPTPNSFNVVYRDNVFQRGSNGKCAAYGPVTDFDVRNTGNAWTCNIWDNGGAGRAAPDSSGGSRRRLRHRPRRLSDDAEVRRYHTDPRGRDTDGDGLLDGAEVNRYHTNPRQRDTDRDGLTDNAGGPPLPHRPAQARHRPRRAPRRTPRSTATTPTRATATPTATGGAIEPRFAHGTNPRDRRSRPDGLEVIPARTARGGACAAAIGRPRSAAPAPSHADAERRDR